MEHLEEENNQLRSELTEARRRIAGLNHQYDIFKAELEQEKNEKIMEYKEAIRILRNNTSVFSNDHAEEAAHLNEGEGSIEEEIVAVDELLLKQEFSRMKQRKEELSKENSMLMDKNKEYYKHILREESEIQRLERFETFAGRYPEILQKLRGIQGNNDEITHQIEELQEKLRIEAFEQRELETRIEEQMRVSHALTAKCQNADEHTNSLNAEIARLKNLNTGLRELMDGRQRKLAKRDAVPADSAERRAKE